MRKKKAKPAKSKGKEIINQRPKLLPSTLNNNAANDNVCSSDEDDRIESVAIDSRITYAIAMNNRMVQAGCSSSGSSSGGCNGSGGNSGSSTNVETETAAAAAVEQTAERYPKRQRRRVNYQEQLDTPDDDYYICKYILFSTVQLDYFKL